MPHRISIKSMLLNRTVIRHLDITLCSFMHYTTKHHLCRHNGSLFDVKWRIKFSCKINFTAVSFISGERMRKGRLWYREGRFSVCSNQWENSKKSVVEECLCLSVKYFGLRVSSCALLHPLITWLLRNDLETTTSKEGTSTPWKCT